MSNGKSAPNLYRGKSLDEWVQMNNLRAVREDIRCHVEQYVQDEEGIESLTRLVLISIRDKMSWEN